MGEIWVYRGPHLRYLPSGRPDDKRVIPGDYLEEWSDGQWLPYGLPQDTPPPPDWLTAAAEAVCDGERRERSNA